MEPTDPPAAPADAETRFRRVEALFHAVADLPPAAVKPYLDIHAVDAAERAEVEALLAADRDGAEAQLGGIVPTALDSASSDPHLIGQHIGPWKLTGTYGSGGMGTVYRAERDDGTYAQRAALKLVRSFVASPMLTARFLAERQILARLEHPGIARLLDGGTHEGIPWLAMEAVDGEPIDRWCAGRPLVERIALFRQVCAAVQHAHRNLVVHRDLKPSNVLVTTDGTPKLLDFGIAKLIEPEESGKERTRTQFRMLTPEYASPEQLLGEPVTTASDIYSLGVLLFRLLTGISPYATTEDGRRNPAALAASDDTLTRPSLAVLREAGDDTGSLPRPQLSRALRGDLDAIVMKALRRDPAARYASAAAFAEDLQRHLDLLPVLARRESARYQMTRFARRHWRGLAVAGAVIVGVTALVGHYTAQLEQRRQDAERAHLEAVSAERTAQHVTDFLVATIGQTGIADRSTSRTLAEVLDDATRRIETELTDEPRARAAVLRALGRTWEGFRSADDKAERLLRDAMALYEAQEGLGSPMSIDIRYRLIPVLQRQRKGAEALALGEEALPAAEARLPADSLDLAKLLVILSSGYRGGSNGPVDRSLDYLMRARGIMDRAQPPPRDKDRSAMYRGLVLDYTMRRHYRSALEASAQEERVLTDPIPFNRSRTFLARGLVALRLGDAKLARNANEQAIALSIDTHPPDSPGGHYPQVLRSLSCALGGDYGCAGELAGRIAPGPIALGGGHALTRQGREALLSTEILLDAGRARQALDRLQPWIAVRDQLPAESADEAGIDDALIAAALAAGDADLAERSCQRRQARGGTESGGARLRRFLELGCAPLAKLRGDDAGYRDAARRLAVPADDPESGESLDRVLSLLLRADAEHDRQAAEAAVTLTGRLSIGNRLRVDALRQLAALLPAEDPRPATLRAEAAALEAAAGPLADRLLLAARRPGR